MAGTDPPAASDERSGALTHLDEAGRAHMVNVSAKPHTSRRALARGRVVLSRSATMGPSSWAELFSVARVAGIQAAKQTALLIPLCHPLPVSDVEVAFERREREIAVEARAQVVGQTGVEMEALTACAVAALTLVSALVDEDPGASVEDLALWEKSGGRSGSWSRR